jgi:hypothetical protein
MVHGLEPLVLGVEKRAAGDDPQPGRLAPGDDPARRLALHDHGADEGAVGPREVLVGEAPDVQVHEPRLPAARQHGRHRQQPQRRQRGALAHELQRVLEAPERVRELRVDQKDVHAAAVCHHSAREGNPVLAA